MYQLDGDKLTLLSQLLDREGDVAVISHIHPDGDAVGSSIALASYIRWRSGRKASVILPGKAPSYLDFLAAEESIIYQESSPEEAQRALAECSLAVCVDFNQISRAGLMEHYIRESSCTKILIDHHVGPESEAFDLVFSDSGISSASELVFWILNALEGGAGSLPELTRTALMTGMTTDTNNFANSVYPSTLSMAGMLLESGVDRDGIIGHIYNEDTENKFRARAWILDNCLKTLDCGIAYIIIPRSESLKLGLAEGDTDGLVNRPLTIKDIRLSILCTEEDGHFRVSLRSKRGTSARDMAMKYFNGGGHEMASGGKVFFPGDIARAEDIENYILQASARFVQDETTKAPNGRSDIR